MRYTHIGNSTTNSFVRQIRTRLFQSTSLMLFFSSRPRPTSPFARDFPWMSHPIAHLHSHCCQYRVIYLRDRFEASRELPKPQRLHSCHRAISQPNRCSLCTRTLIERQTRSHHAERFFHIDIRIEPTTRSECRAHMKTRIRTQLRLPCNYLTV
jgi:hypothetical protein